MTKNINAHCMICGKGYHMCLSCNDIMRLRPWQIHTDTSEHYKIYQILHGYTTGVYNKKETREKLQLVDLSDINSFKEDVKSAIQEVMEDVENKILDEEVIETKPKTGRKKKSTNVVETEDNIVPTLD